MIDLAPKHLDEVKRILAEQVPGVEVRAYGSRVSGTARPYSDLDLALVGDEKIDGRRIEALKDAFAESDLPFMVDVLDFHAISESFRQVILTRGFEMVQEKAAGAPEQSVTRTCGTQ
jgi:uncharacterized protein